MIHKVLKKVYGYDAFRPLQQESIEAVLEGKDVLLILPTGGGKSICFQVPALVQKGLSIVISPLIALMDDQVVSLRENGISARSLHSNIKEEDRKEIFKELNDGTLSLLYISPEGLLVPSFLEYISKEKVNLIAVDEAHCISMWGNDFRGDYTKLSSLHEHFPGVPIMAVTATADKATQDDICNQLKLKEPEVFIGSFDRANLFLETRPGTDRLPQIITYLKKRRDTASIIYCTSRKSTESTSDKLKKEGILSAHYHAGMSSDERKKVHLDFLHDKVDVVCATIAFGMGIDKSNIRSVIHYNLPKNIESYYQEIGRAGRDGADASCLLFYSYADMINLKRFIDESQATEQYKLVLDSKLERLWDFANTPNCRTNIVLSYFGELRKEPCGHCDNCKNPPEKIDGTKYAQIALSGIARTKENITIATLVDIVRGSGKQDIFRNGYDQLKTYGVGRDLPANDWRAYITQLINKGYIRIDYQAYSKLKLTSLAKEVLFNKEKVELAKYVWQEKVKTSSKKPKKKIIQDELFEALRKCRKELATKAKVPPYVIFHDSVLHEMVRSKPVDIREMSELSGVGKVKLKKYGEVFMTIIREYIQTQKHLKKIRGKTKLETLNMFNEGLSTSEIASSRSLSEGTVISHLIELYESGENIEIQELITVDDIANVKASLDTVKLKDSLTAIKEKTNPALDYNTIKIALSVIKKTEAQ